VTGDRALRRKYRQLGRPLYQRGWRRWVPITLGVASGALALALGGSFVVMLVAVAVAGAAAGAAVQWQARRVEAREPDPVQRLVDEALARVRDRTD
jgi:hypothetical protein